jgi:hypothetical protein
MRMRPSSPATEYMVRGRRMALASTATLHMQTWGQGWDFPSTPPERATCFLTVSWRCPCCMQTMSVTQALLLTEVLLPFQQGDISFDTRHRQAKGSSNCPAKVQIEVAIDPDPVGVTLPWFMQIWRMLPKSVKVWYRKT